VLSSKCLGVSGDREIRSNRLHEPPQQQRPDKLAGELFRISPTKRPVAHEPAHQILQGRVAIADAGEEVNASVAGESHAVGQENAKELLLAGFSGLFEDEEGEARQRIPCVTNRCFLQGGQHLHDRRLLDRKQRFEQLCLAWEVVVDGALGDADGAGDVADAGAEKAALGEEGQRRIHDRLTGALAARILRSCH